MDEIFTPETLAAVKAIDFSNPATIKTAAIALIVLAVVKGGKLFAKLLLKGALAVAKKTKTTLDDEVLAAAEQELQKK